MERLGLQPASHPRERAARPPLSWIPSQEPLSSVAGPLALPDQPMPGEHWWFEALLSEVVVRLLDSEPHASEAAIRECLTGLATWLHCERVSLAAFGNGGVSWCATHGEAHPGQEPTWYVDQLRAGRRIVAPRVPDGLPPTAGAECAIAAAFGLKSMLALPLKAGGQVLGGLQLEHFARHCSWPPELVSRLELLASLLGQALERRRAQARTLELQGELAEARAALETSVREAGDVKARLDEGRLPESTRGGVGGGGEIVGTSTVLARVLGQVEQVASTEAPVLLLGETGTGKELVARALHDRSRRRQRPLVVVNCAALPATLVESELFGYEKGAFTGAAQRTAGRFEAAHGGTLFLDEIGELPPEAQGKLLRVLQTGEFERLGSSKTIRANVRLIAATNRDLGREVREGRFRADLFYRLSVFPIALPPLRERKEDIPLLVWHFIARRQASLGRAVKQIPDELMRALCDYAWPGNVRELENVMERALILTSGPTLAADPAFLPAGPTRPAACGSSTLADAERAHIQSVLDACDWKVSGKGNAAERLGLNRSTLQFRMKKLGITRPGQPA